MYSDLQQMEKFLCLKNECSVYVKQAKSFARYDSRLISMTYTN